jgi:hypothetical protein
MIVAESLAEVEDPLETILALGEPAPAALVAGTIARSLAPLESATGAPPWLQPEQIAPFRRAIAALERYGGVLLADPVGSGKTFIALAVARALGRDQETTVLAPAVLRQQWLGTAARLGVAIRLITHEAVSRGCPPAARSSLVVVDESHRFRNPETRRYANLAPWLVGRRAMLLSATPVVNRLGDLAAQLLLTIRDDALAARGCPSLSQAIHGGDIPAALGDLVLCRPRPPATPASRLTSIRPRLTAAEGGLLESIEGLALSRHPGIALLLRMGLCRALASSPAALAGALDRYDRLLQHAEAAARTGRQLGRSSIRAFTGADLEQLALWELLPDPGGTVDLVTDDRAKLAALLGRSRALAGAPDEKCLALQALVADGEMTLAFTTSRDTVTWLRHHLAGLRPAWVSGTAAGIGGTTMQRDDVLGWFGPDPPVALRCRAGVRPDSRPRLLLATDVAAEGLDLQGVGRVVHYDLPWTSVRLDQRSGRAVRLGASRALVELVEFVPPPEIEDRLRQLERLTAKRGLAARVLAGGHSDWPYRWRVELQAWAGEGPETPGIVVIPGQPAGWLFGLAIDRLDGSGRTQPAPASLIWLGEDGSTCEAPDELVRLLRRAAAERGRPPSDGERRQAIRALRPLVRERLRRAAGQAWQGPRHPPDVRLAVRRLTRLAASAARRRDRALLELLDRTLAWLRGGLTAGERTLLNESRGLGIESLSSVLDRLVRRPREPWVPVPRLTGVVCMSRREPP